MLLFFTPIYQISRTDDRTKANIHERKRIAIVHAKFDFAENTHYSARFRIMAFVTRLFSRHYCAYNGTPFNSCYNEYNGVILTRHYCAYNDMVFVLRNTRHNAGDFDVSLLCVW